MKGEVLCLRNARLAQLVERKTLNLVVVGSSPTVGTVKFRQRFEFRRRSKNVNAGPKSQGGITPSFKKLNAGSKSQGGIE